MVGEHHDLSNEQILEGSRYVLRIRDFLPIILFWGWDVSTINPTNFREGSGFLGIIFIFVSSHESSWLVNS